MNDILIQKENENGEMEKSKKVKSLLKANSKI